jgi:hypothetical protein
MKKNSNVIRKGGAIMTKKIVNGKLVPFTKQEIHDEISEYRNNDVTINHETDKRTIYEISRCNFDEMNENEKSELMDCLLAE